MKPANKKAALLLLLLALPTLACRATLMSRTATPPPAPTVIYDNSGTVAMVIGLVIVVLVVAIVVIGLRALVQAGRDNAMENVVGRLLDERQQHQLPQGEDEWQGNVAQPQQPYLPPQQQQYLPSSQAHSAWLYVQPKNPNQPIWYEGEVVLDIARQIHVHPADAVVLLQQGRIALWDPATQQQIKLLPPPSSKGTALQRRNNR